MGGDAIHDIPLQSTELLRKLISFKEVNAIAGYVILQHIIFHFSFFHIIIIVCFTLFDQELIELMMILGSVRMWRGGNKQHSMLCVWWLLVSPFVSLCLTLRVCHHKQTTKISLSLFFFSSLYPSLFSFSSD